MLKKIFGLEYPLSDTLPMAHVFNQLDWWDRGFLLRTEVEKHIFQALITVFFIDNQMLMDIINSCDTNHNGTHFVHCPFK